MAVRLEGAIHRYIGLSTDIKPTDATGQTIPAGSSFLEEDTGRIARWNGDRWTLPQLPDDQAEYLAAILSEMQQLREAVDLFRGMEWPVKVTNP